MIENTVQIVCNTPIKVLYIHPAKMNMAGYIPFGLDENSPIKLYRWDYQTTEYPVGNFDFGVIYIRTPDEKCLRQIITKLRKNAPFLPIFGFFDKLSVRSAIKLLKLYFSDVRIMPESPHKLANYIVLWKDKIAVKKLRQFSLHRIRSLSKKITGQQWFSNQMRCIHNELDQIKNYLDSYELWHRHGLDRELKLAHSIQTSFLSNCAPSFRYFDIEAFCKPAKEVGGDFFDFCKIDTNRLGFVIGDVATRGIPAALLMTEIRGMWRALMKNAPSTKFVVSQMNSLLCKDLKNMWGLFVTLFCGVLDSQNSTLHYTNAGHCYPVLCKKNDGILTELRSGGRILGISPKTYYQEKIVPLSTRDLIVCYTDGITEAHNDYKSFFGKEKLYQIIKKNSHRSVKYIKDTICKQVDAFSEFSANHDDQALLIMRYKNKLIKGGIS